MSALLKHKAEVKEEKEKKGNSQEECFLADDSTETIVIFQVEVQNN